MNILVLTAAGNVVVRPDTTWERDSEDFYVPEFIDRISATRVLFVRICKPGRSVDAKFAERYYDGFGRGILLYPEDLADGGEEGYARACCLDHTSFLTFPVKDKAGLGEPEAAAVREAIARVTKFCYIRTGDVIAIESEGRKPLCGRSDGRFEVREGECNFDIIF